MRRTLVFTALLLAIPARGALGQYAGPGDTIRVVLESGPVHVIEGTLAGVSDDSIFITLPNKPGVRLARAAVKGVFVSREGEDLGTGGGWAGMSFGFVIGAAGGIVLAGPRILGRMLGAVGGAVVGACVGAITGEAIGSHFRDRIWVAIPWPSTPIAGPAPQ